MEERRELGFFKTSASSLREQAARTTLRNVRMQGHPYVELREDGKRFIFFCTLCLSPCYSDSVLYDHLKGNLHSERYAAAKATLLKSHPWPFNDGVLFFQNSSENDKHRLIANGNPTRQLTRKNDNNLAIVCHGDGLSFSNNRNVEQPSNNDSDCDINSDNECLNNFGKNSVMMIPGVMVKDEVTELEVRFMGIGQISARFFEKNGVSKGIGKIWCEWLGRKEPGDGDTLMVPDHNFAVVTFNYHYDLGRKGLFDDVISMLSSSPTEGGKKRKKSFSDPEDISESLSNQYDSSGDDSLMSNSSSPRLLLDRYDDQLLDTRFISSKSLRRELRRQQRVAAERMCDICQHRMLPGKDVATLMNMKTGKLVCSSRNVYGAFHVFHTSCLLHWLLLCEFEILTSQLVSPKLRRSSRRKSGSKCKGKGKRGVIKSTTPQICSVFCPECQGTGLQIEEDELEIPNVPLSEMFKYKIKVSDAHRAWMKNPEELKHCSTGFDFPSQSGETVQEKVSPLKLLHFYGADE